MSTVRSIYRCLLRDARELQRIPHYNIRRDLQLEKWGIGSFVKPLTYHEQQELKMHESRGVTILMSLEEFRKLRDHAFRMRPLTTVDLTKSIQVAFRQHMKLNDPKVTSAKVDEAIEALSELSDQLLLAKCSTVTVTDGVRIEATSKYLQSHSNPGSNIYRFTYRITITNQNEECSVQILGRQYTFESEKGQRIALKRFSPGIVGATPLLAPGQIFEYASGIDIDAPRGSVTGCLHALRKSKTLNAEEGEAGEHFDALVSKFSLLAPHALTKR
ncbi:unnamed protein product [Peronospora belbahrii]|uniref:ApaG domain-containing protein n=1 Tax=Peronospora belbahrii TaxID=622444 RepID=A0AAU9L155_9STRA|nr:unnamed protein product [Peronospora belbahrii]CAH0515809.1 unnamed protein product [Peronospora belbahrii]